MAPSARILSVVSASIEKSDADEGQAEVGCGLDVVASQDAESAGILREGFVDGEFGAKIGDLECAGIFGGDFRYQVGAAR